VRASVQPVVQGIRLRGSVEIVAREKLKVIWIAHSDHGQPHPLAGRWPGDSCISAQRSTTRTAGEVSGVHILAPLPVTRPATRTAQDPAPRMFEPSLPDSARRDTQCHSRIDPVQRTRSRTGRLDGPNAACCDVRVSHVSTVRRPTHPRARRSHSAATARATTRTATKSLVLELADRETATVLHATPIRQLQQSRDGDSVPCDSHLTDRNQHANTKSPSTERGILGQRTRNRLREFLVH